jgi:hypothetical protein
MEHLRFVSRTIATVLRVQELSVVRSLDTDHVVLWGYVMPHL